MSSKNDPIAVYDSGVGGLSVLRAIREQLPNEKLIYLGDQAHVPYGERSMEELRSLAEAVTRFFLSQKVKMLVVACNTASAAALKHLRLVFPQLPFVGMEPALKPASQHTHSGKVGVLATPATFAGELYASVVERFAQNVKIYQSTCPGLVAQIEKGAMQSKKTRAILEEAIQPMLDEGVDRLVLGCTHYPFVIPQIEEILAGRAEVVDPAPAVARQVKRVLESLDLLADSCAEGDLKFMTTASPDAFLNFLKMIDIAPAKVQTLNWQQGVLIQPKEGL
jgi:glutamate racemase